jgi:type II pantothenate kinase
MVNDAEVRKYWLDVFEHHTESLRRRSIESDPRPDAAERAAACCEKFDATVRHLRMHPNALGPLSILVLCNLRTTYLAEFDFHDPYRPMKQKENDAAMRLLPDVLRELDAHRGEELLSTLIRGVFAGNIFDMGCASTVGLYERGEMDFFSVRSRLPQRPWRVDDFDALAARWATRRYRKVVMFIDNAGADFVLGMLPLARYLLQRGLDLVITANSAPALNDVTYPELVELIARVARIETTFADALDAGQLSLAPSGNHLPVIDLSKVSPQLAEASRDADLLIIEGMGRALETNYRARFTCDTLKLAMIKEQNVADLFPGGELYDVVCRFEPVD